MSYSERDFRLQLERELSEGYDVVRIARMAFHEYFSHTGEISPELEQKIFQIVAMEEGPEFQFSEQELWEFARDLTEGDHAGGPVS